MTARQVAFPTAVVAFVAGAWDLFPVFVSRLLDAPLGPGYSIWFLGGIIAIALNPGGILAVGYWASAGTDISTEWAAYAAWTFVGAVAGYIAGGLFGHVVVSVFTEYPRSDVGNRPYYSIVQTSLYESVRAAIAGIAGASIGHFRLN